VYRDADRRQTYTLQMLAHFMPMDYLRALADLKQPTAAVIGDPTNSASLQRSFGQFMGCAATYRCGYCQAFGTSAW
jgi:hypothetical protein